MDWSNGRIKSISLDFTSKRLVTILFYAILISKIKQAIDKLKSSKEGGTLTIYWIPLNVDIKFGLNYKFGR